MIRSTTRASRASLSASLASTRAADASANAIARSPLHFDAWKPHHAVRMAVTESIATATISMKGRCRHRDTGAARAGAAAVGAAGAEIADSSLMAAPSSHPTRVAAHNGTALRIRATRCARRRSRNTTPARVRYPPMQFGSPSPKQGR